MIAHEAQAKHDKGSKDWAFYEGKKQAAIYFANTVLPEVIAKSKILSSGDKSPMEIPTEAFATV